MESAAAEEFALAEDETCDKTGGKSCRKLMSPIIGRLRSLAGIINAGLFFGTTGSTLKWIC